MCCWVLLVCDSLLPSAGRYGIMLACWQGEPKERPMFPALVQILADLLQDNSLPVSPSETSSSINMLLFDIFELFLTPSGRERLQPLEPLTELRG